MPHLNVKHTIKGDRYVLDTDLKPSGVEEVLETFIRMQMGKGADYRRAPEREVYEIFIEVDLSDDSFSVRDNCGNKGLRDGILMCLLKELHDRPGAVKFV